MNEIFECSVFFSTLNGISTFSSHSRKRTIAIQDHLKKTIPSFAPTRWCFTSRILITVEKYREPIIEFFTKINEDSDDEWKGVDGCAAYGFVQFLESFRTVFLLKLFSPLFARTDFLFKVLQSEHLDIVTCLNVIRDFQEELQCSRAGFRNCQRCKENKSKASSQYPDDHKCDECEKWDLKICGMIQSAW